MAREQRLNDLLAARARIDHELRRMGHATPEQIAAIERRRRELWRPKPLDLDELRAHMRRYEPDPPDVAAARRAVLARKVDA